MSIESRYCDNFCQLDGVQCSNNAGHRYKITMLNMQSVGRFLFSSIKEEKECFAFYCMESIFSLCSEGK